MGLARGATLIAVSAALVFGCNDSGALSDADGRLRRFADALATSQASHSLRRLFCLKHDHPDFSEDCAALNGLISAMEERIAAHPEEGPRCPAGKGSPDEAKRCSCEWAWVQIGAAKAALAAWTEVVRANNLVAFPKTPPPRFIADMEQSGSEQANKFWTLGCKPPSK